MRFTFHYASTYTTCCELHRAGHNIFTFHYASTYTCRVERLDDCFFPLHSTMIHISYSFIKNSIAAVAEEIGSAGFNTKLNEERNKGAFVMSPHAGDIERLLSKSSKLAGEVRDEKA